MFCNKKGDWSSFKNIIILLLVAAILIPLTYIILNEGSRSADIAACKNWVILQSSTKIVPGVGVLIKELNIPCTTFQDKAKGEKYEVYETIAKSMYDVWNMYGRGEIDFLTDKSWFAQFDSNVYCFIGDEISFDENIKINSMDVNDFEDYLSHNYPEKSESTYSEFFMKAENSDIDFGDGTIEIDPSEKLYIIYAVEKKSPNDLKGVGLNVLEGVALNFLGITLSKKAIPGIGSLSTKKVFTGTFAQPRAPAGGTTIGGKFYKAGQFIPKSASTTLRGAVGKLGTVGLVVGTIGTIAYVTSDQSIMIPSLLVMQGKDVIKAGCEAGIHYKPKSKKEELKFRNE